jgi:hypothetical protein
MLELPDVLLLRAAVPNAVLVLTFPPPLPAVIPFTAKSFEKVVVSENVFALVIVCAVLVVT